MPFLDETRTLLEVVERQFPANPVLVNTFFAGAVTFPTSVVDIDYKKGGRPMAPFVTHGSKGVNMRRDGFVTKTYNVPLMKPRRVLTVEDLAKRQAGEGVYSTRTAEQRAEEYRLKDIADLTQMCIRTEEYMAAKLLCEGEYDITGYADDGKLEVVDTIKFDFTQKLTCAGSDKWTDAGSDIYSQMQEASRIIRRNAGMVPTVMMCSEKTAQCMLDNKSIVDKLMIPSTQNMALMSIQPKIQNPEVIRFGFMQSLNLEMYTYDGIYQVEKTEQNKEGFAQYLPDGYAIIGVPGRGKRLYGAVTLLEDDGYHTYESRYVPKVTVDKESDTSTISINSRCLVVPESIDDWFVIKAF